MAKPSPKLLIRNYGLHWRRDCTAWGAKGAGHAGHLDGREVTRSSAPLVDFRRQAGIYVLHEGFRPVYVGQVGRGTERLFDRLKMHTRNHLAERWDRYSWFGLLPVKGEVLDESVEKTITAKKEQILDHLEGILINITEPPLNRQGARMGAADQYRQSLAHLNEDVEEPIQ